MVMRRYEQLFAALEQANQEHYDQIRTSLGHPECQEELAFLEKKERERQFKTTKGRYDYRWLSTTKSQISTCKLPKSNVLFSNKRKGQGTAKNTH